MSREKPLVSHIASLNILSQHWENKLVDEAGTLLPSYIPKAHFLTLWDCKKLQRLHMWPAYDPCVFMEPR